MGELPTYDEKSALLVVDVRNEPPFEVRLSPSLRALLAAAEPATAPTS